MEEEMNPQETVQVQEETPSPGETAENPFEDHILGLQQQAEQMRREFPDFDLVRELQDPVFLQLTAPGTGISVADAYYALHRQDLQKSQVRQTREQVVSAIQAGSRRPVESGADSKGPGSLSFRYENATREQREAFKKELRRAWGRGETVYPR